MEWYRWSTLEAAQAALDYINSSPALPYVGECCGAPDPEAQQTLRWCDAVTECRDGKFGFERITTYWLDELEVSQEDRAAFLSTYVTDQGGEIEEYDPAWVEYDEEGSSSLSQ